MNQIAKNILRKILPRRLISTVRLLNVFQVGHGHIKTHNGFPVNAKGEYQPWLTYPLIEYLNGIDFSCKRIFEFGAGSSTIFWAKRAFEVVSVEFDAEWYRSLLGVLPVNVKLIHEPDGLAYASKILNIGQPFDVIVIDGAERYRSAEFAIKMLAPGGMIILDNAEWYPNTANFIRNSGLIEMRFSGFSPVNAFTSTSTLFLHRDFDFPANTIARMPPVGGVSIPGGTLDDGQERHR